jgi:AcrR family transcriptional regulator
MSKGERTRAQVLDHAIELASRDGLEGLTIGTLAARAGLSKSGLYAHFGSKEQLQLEVLQEAVDRFRAAVIAPAVAARGGEPRVHALFDRWLAWGTDSGMPGGCLITSAASELDDRPGPPRELLARMLQEWIEFLGAGASSAIAKGHFRADLDPKQFAYDLYAIFLAFHLAHRMMRDQEAEPRARKAFERLLSSARV